MNEESMNRYLEEAIALDKYVHDNEHLAPMNAIAAFLAERDARRAPSPRCADSEGLSAEEKEALAGICPDPKGIICGSYGECGHYPKWREVLAALVRRLLSTPTESEALSNREADDAAQEIIEGFERHAGNGEDLDAALSWLPKRLMELSRLSTPTESEAVRKAKEDLRDEVEKYEPDCEDSGHDSRYCSMCRDMDRGASQFVERYLAALAAKEPAK